MLESLIAAGACDSLGGHRKQLLEALDAALGEAQLRQQEREAGQASLFGEVAADRARAGRRCPTSRPGPEAERLAREKEVIGFFISGPPAGAVPRRRWSCSAPAPPPRCTSGASTR